MNVVVKMLVVEDNEDDARLMIRVLRAGGFAPTYRRVQDVVALRQALDSERWDAIISDFTLPSFNGLDALKVFRASGLDIPFIFCSGTMGETTAVAAMKGGASDYVMKNEMARLAPVLEREMAQATIRADHRQGQIDLARSRDRYVDLYDMAPVGYLTLAADGLIAQLNLTSADMLGAPRERLVNAGFAQFVQPKDNTLWQAHLQHALKCVDKHRLELELERADGTRFCAQLDSTRVPGDDSAPAATVRIAMTDISDSKAAEAHLHRVELQVLEMQKMESIGVLAGGIAHDFNNILGVILGNVGLARQDLGANHPALKSLEEIQKAGDRARDLVGQILSFSRRDPPRLVAQPLRPVIEETHKLLRATLPARVELDMLLTDAPLRVWADATQIQQVLMNLCTNAWQALLDNSGRIGVGLEAVTIDVDIARQLGGLLPGPHAHLWVSDTGGGMDAATCAHIFEPFFTTKPVGLGTGLGLSVVHGIVVAHHGAIAVDSSSGKGTTFHLYFPALEGAVDAPTAVNAPPTEAAPGQGAHVMYIDDDETMVIMVTRVLERAGYQPTGFRDAVEAVAAVRARPGEFDCVVSDFNMPGLSGVEVARALAAIRPALPIAISSGYITDEMRDEARAAGVRELLEKQHTFQELGFLVARLLAQVDPRGSPPSP